MTSSTRIDSTDLVQCRIVHDKIPVQICAGEQGTSACNGCTAPTRRCKVCGVARGIAEPIQGLCQACIKPGKPRALTRTRLFEGSSEDALEEVFRLARTIENTQKVRRPLVDAKRTSTVKVLATGDASSGKRQKKTDSS